MVNTGITIPRAGHPSPSFRAPHWLVHCCSRDSKQAKYEIHYTVIDLLSCREGHISLNTDSQAWCKWMKCLSAYSSYHQMDPNFSQLVNATGILKNTFVIIFVWLIIIVMEFPLFWGLGLCFITKWLKTVVACVGGGLIPSTNKKGRAINLTEKNRREIAHKSTFCQFITTLQWKNPLEILVFPSHISFSKCKNNTSFKMELFHFYSQIVKKNSQSLDHDILMIINNQNS